MNHKITIILWLITLVLTTPNGWTQTILNKDEWSEKFNTTGVKLVLKETGRSRLNGRTEVHYSLFASGMTLNIQYTIWTRLVGNDPQPVAIAFLNREGKAVSQLADAKDQIAEDPINVKVFAGRGEPKEFALVSNDGKFRAFARVIPFPIESSDGSCHLTAAMTEPNYIGVLISISGLIPSEELLIATESGHETERTKGKATAWGRYDSIVFPAVKGKRSGSVRFNVTAKSCKVGIVLPWGEGSYELQ